LTMKKCNRLVVHNQCLLQSSIEEH